jgi:glycosyltransferase involved in cell wall biosynthesis
MIEAPARSSETPSEQPVRPLRIVYLATEMGLGGAETITKLLFDEWRALGHDPHMILTYQPGVIAQRMQQDGYPVTALNTPRGLRSMLGVPYIRRLIRDLMPDVIVLNNQDSLLPWAWSLGSAVRSKRVPVMAVVHSSAEGQLELGDRIHQWFLPRFDRVIVLGEPHKCYAHRRFGVPNEKLFVVHNGVPAKPAVTLEMPLPSLPQNAVIGVIVARLHPEKNHRMLLEATQAVIQQHPEFHLLIVGQGETRHELEAFTKTLGSEDHVHFLGARSDVSAILDCADIGLLSSINETFSVALLEYMRAGLPVIATRTGSLEDQVQEGHTGFLVAPRDTAALTKALGALVTDSGLRKQLGKAGLALQAHQFTSQRMSQAYLGLFRQRIGVLNQVK